MSRRPLTQLDIGRLTGRYLQVLGLLSIAGMLAGAVFFDRASLDLSFILFFLAGGALVEHSPVARKLVIGACALILLASILGTAAMVTDIGSVRMSMFGGRIKDPSPALAIAFLATACGVFGPPLVLLLLPRARLEFAAREDQCRHCGYDLRGAPRGVCPECGHEDSKPH